MSLMKTETPTTEIETVNPNPTAEVSTEPTAETGTETEEPTATVAAEPERQYTCREGCGLTGPVGAFKAPDLKNIVAAIRAATGQKTGRVTITVEQMAAHATCEACAKRVSAERGVGYWPLQWGLDRVVAAKLAKPAEEQQAPVVVDNDPEAQTLVACCLCEKQIARADAVVSWWGAKLLANGFLGRDGGLATNREVNQMLLNNTGIGEGAQKCPAVCKDCAVLARPRLIEAASALTFVKLMDDEERQKQFSYQLKPMPLMVAIRKAREYEAKGAAMAAEEEAARAKEEAEVEAKAKQEATLTAKLQSFLGSAVSRTPHKGGGNPGKGGKHNNGRNDGRERGGGNRGRYTGSNDD